MHRLWNWGTASAGSFAFTKDRLPSSSESELSCDAAEFAFGLIKIVAILLYLC